MDYRLVTKYGGPNDFEKDLANNAFDLGVLAMDSDFNDLMNSDTQGVSIFDFYRVMLMTLARDTGRDYVFSFFHKLFPQALRAHRSKVEDFLAEQETQKLKQSPKTPTPRKAPQSAKRKRFVVESDNESCADAIVDGPPQIRRFPLTVSDQKVVKQANSRAVVVLDDDTNGVSKKPKTTHVETKPICPVAINAVDALIKKYPKATPSQLFAFLNKELKGKPSASTTVFPDMQFVTLRIQQHNRK